MKKETWHGTVNGYRYHRCRCELCRLANSKEGLAYNHRSGRSLPREDYIASLGGRTCGTISAYNAGCRCPACRAVSRERRRIYRERHRQAVDA